MHALGVANVVLGVALGIYTGILLNTMVARPLWNSAILGPLFTGDDTRDFFDAEAFDQIAGNSGSSQAQCPTLKLLLSIMEGTYFCGRSISAAFRNMMFVAVQIGASVEKAIASRPGNEIP